MILKPAAILAFIIEPLQAVSVYIKKLILKLL